MREVTKFYVGGLLFAAISIVGFTSAASILLGYIPVSPLQSSYLFALTFIVAELFAACFFTYKLRWLYTWGFHDKEKSSLISGFAAVSSVSAVASFITGLSAYGMLGPLWNYLVAPPQYRIVLPTLSRFLVYVGVIVVLAVTVAGLIAVTYSLVGKRRGRDWSWILKEKV